MEDIQLQEQYQLYLIQALFEFDFEEYILSYEEFCSLKQLDEK